MERDGCTPSENRDVASKIQYRVRNSGFAEFSSAEIGQKTLPYRSEIEVHPLFERDGISFDRYAFEVGSKGLSRISKIEFPQIEILGIPEAGNVEKRIEASFGFAVNPKAFREERDESVGDVEPFRPIEDRKRGIGNEP